MKKLFYLAFLLACVLRFPVAPVLAQTEDKQEPLVLSDAVLPTPSKNPLLDARIFNPEFYRKFNPDLNLSTGAGRGPLVFVLWVGVEDRPRCCRSPILFRSEAILFPEKAAAPREWTLHRVETLPSLSRNHN